MTAHNKSIYNSRTWRRLRAAKLSASPLCEPCEAAGRITVATVVDHRTSIETGGAAFPGLDGLMSMCAQCHNSKTHRVEQLGQPNVIKGHDLEGYPLDRDHSFFSRGYTGSKDGQRPKSDRGGAKMKT